MTPVIIPGGNPVMEVPGLTPKSPLSIVGPVFVTDAPPRTEYDSSVPKPTVGPSTAACAAIKPREETDPKTTAAPSEATPNILTLFFIVDFAFKSGFLFCIYLVFSVEGKIPLYPTHRVNSK